MFFIVNNVLIGVIVKTCCKFWGLTSMVLCNSGLNHALWHSGTLVSLTVYGNLYESKKIKKIRYVL